MKKCIFYLPYELDEHGNGARMLRPRKMIQAFKDIGYEVFEITGYSKERRARIKELKRRIKKGEVFDFMYAESHTEPTLLTNPNHLPTHPFLDFGFFKFIKKHGIKIGLFYCDIYWKFDNYGADLPGWKRQGALWCYRYDIRQYKKYLDKFYTPNLGIFNYLNEPELKKIAGELFPGSDPIEVKKAAPSNQGLIEKPLHIFYVGGLGNHYNIIELVKAVNLVDKCELTICCRKAEWEKEKSSIEPYMNDRIHIIHKNSDELSPYFEQADICSLLFKRGTYIDMSIPFKSFEYLANEKPVLATEGTAISKFVEENGIGWSTEFEAEHINNLLIYIINNQNELKEKSQNCITAKQNNLWALRALTVAKDLQ